MKMIPSTLDGHHENGLISDQERQVFEYLKDLNVGEFATCYHSLDLPIHPYKRMGELDFLIISSLGILILEVKGGGVTRDANGIWTTQDRYGVSHLLRESPFDQARSGMFAFEKRIRDLTGEMWSRRELQIGYGVVFPDCVRPILPDVEWDPAVLIDSSDFATISSFGSAILNLYNYWRSHNGTVHAFNENIMRGVKTVIRPEFELIPNISSTALQIENRLEQLTEDQYRFIDVFEENPRVICSGGAGTGKTFLAAEAARRAGLTGKSVAVICKSASLASFLSERLRSVTERTKSNVIIASMDTFIRASRSAGKVDYLIVDEAQDVLDWDGLNMLDQWVHGGISGGSWTMFLDRNNQGAAYGVFDETTLEYLQGTNAINVPLKRNCRNTESIVFQTRLCTGADLGTSTAGSGPRIIYEFPGNELQEAEALRRQLSLWESENVDPGSITVLSPRNWNESSARILNEFPVQNIVILKDDFGQKYPSSQITFAQIIDFKGFENRFIALIDFDSIEMLGKDLSNLYIGMTRAKAALWVSIRQNLQPDLQRLQMNHIELMRIDGSKHGTE